MALSTSWQLGVKMTNHSGHWKHDYAYSLCKCYSRMAGLYIHTSHCTP